MKSIYAALAVLAAIPAQAHGQPVHPSVRVAYTDLDLRSDSGVEALNHRLDRAVRIVCSDRFGATDLATQRAARRCAKAKFAEVAAQRDRIVAARATPVMLADLTR